MDDAYTTREPSHYFLVSYDKLHGTTEVEPFDDAEQAFARYLFAERQDGVRGRNSTVEVVLIGADSVEDVEKLYPHYFARGTSSDRMQRVVDELVG